MPPKRRGGDAPNLDDTAADGPAAPDTAPASPPVRRLDSLRSTPSVTTTTPNASGGSPTTGPGGKALKFKPKAPIRRTQAERDRAEQDEQQRLAARNAEYGESGGAGGQRGGRGRGRGREGGMASRGSTSSRGGEGAAGQSFRGRGASGSAAAAQSRILESTASGPFGGGSYVTPKRQFSKGKAKIEGESRGGGGGGEGGGGGGGAGRSSSVRSRGGGSKSGVKRDKSKVKIEKEPEEEGLQIHAISSDEDDAEGPRQNVEHINLVSDDEDCTASRRAEGWEVKAGLRPVRLGRREHVQRALGVNTDATSSTSASLRQKAKEKGEGKGLFVPQDVDMAGLLSVGATKNKDVEFLRKERKFKGVYDDGESIKSDHDESESAAIGAPPANLPLAQEEPEPDDDTMDVDEPGRIEVDNTGKPMAKTKKPPRSRPPPLQTTEEREEWERHEEDIRALVEDLGMLRPEEIDAQGEVKPDPEEMRTGGGQDPRYGKLYLFQFPPLIPNLAPKSQHHDRTVEQPGTDLTEKTDEKTDPESKTEANPEHKNPTAPTRPTSLTASQMLLPSSHLPQGRAGKLRLHASGRVSLVWGGPDEATDEEVEPSEGQPLLVNRGIQADFLQDVVVASKPNDSPEGPRVPGQSCSVARLKNRFVVVPDWNKLL